MEYNRHALRANSKEFPASHINIYAFLFLSYWHKYMDISIHKYMAYSGTGNTNWLENYLRDNTYIQK